MSKATVVPLNEANQSFHNMQRFRIKQVKPVISVGFVLCLISFSMLANASTPLIEATKNQNRIEVEALLDKGVDADEPQGDGATALHWAAYRNDAVLTDSLLKHGANPNSSDDHGVTPLSLAVLNANLDSVSYTHLTLPTILLV